MHWRTRFDHEIISSPNNNPFVSTIYLHVFFNLKLSQFCALQKSTQARLVRDYVSKLSDTNCPIECVWFWKSVSCADVCGCLYSIPSTYAITNHFQWNKWFFSFGHNSVCYFGNRCRLHHIYSNMTTFQNPNAWWKWMQSFAVFHEHSHKCVQCSVNNAYSKYGIYRMIHCNGRWAKFF